MKKMYNTPEVEVFEFDAEIQMAPGESHLPQGQYGPDLIEGVWNDSLDPGMGGPVQE